MDAAGFKAWRKSLGLTKLAAAEALGIHAETVSNYERGKRRDTGKTVSVPRVVAMACAWLALERSGIIK